jgi:type II secretory pathway component PulF
MREYKIKTLENESIVTEILSAKNILHIFDVIDKPILDIRPIYKNKISLQNRITLDDKIRFFKELQTLLKVDMPILDALFNIKESTSKQRLKKSIQDIISSLKSGKSLYESIHQTKGLFSKTTISLISIGEESGKLDEFLGYIVELLQKDRTNITKIKKAITYPAVTIIALIGAIFFVSAVLIPKFELLYNQNSKKLPLPTQLLIDFNNLITENTTAIIIGFTIFVSIFILLYRFYKLDYLVDKIFFKTIFIKDILFYHQLSQFFLSLHILISVNTNIKKSILSSAELINNRFVKTKLKEAYYMISRGENLAFAMQETNIFPHTTISLLNIGTNAGSISNMLLFISKDYQTKFHNSTDKFITMIEPALISFVSIIVLFLALSMLLPMWNLSSSMGI